MTNVLTDILPDKWRKTLYAIYALIGVGLGAIQVGIASAGSEQPVWLTVSFAVYAFVGGAFGLTAASNVPKPTPVERDPLL